MFSVETNQVQTLGNCISSFSQEEFQNKNDAFVKKLQNAARQGFFYLEIPENCKELIPAAVKFGNHFYQDESITNRPKSGWTGYHKKEDQQKEALFVERALWKSWYPEEVVTLATRMHTQFLTVIQNILWTADIPEKDWGMATGGASEGKGMHHFSFNHYRSGENLPGLNPHRDFGLLTLLYIEKGGLEALIDGDWVPIPPKKDYFVINISRALETFVNNQAKVNAVWHQVVQVKEDRISFGLFSDGGLDTSVLKQQPDGSVSVVYESYKDFVDECFKETYKGNSIHYVEDIKK